MNNEIRKNSFFHIKSNFFYGNFILLLYIIFSILYLYQKKSF